MSFHFTLQFSNYRSCKHIQQKNVDNFSNFKNVHLLIMHIQYFNTISLLGKDQFHKYFYQAPVLFIIRPNL